MSDAPEPPAPGTRRAISAGELHHRLVEHYAPPSVLIDDKLEVVHVSEHAGRYLRVAGGEPSRRLLELVHPALRRDLDAALFAARQHRGTESRLVCYEDEGKRHAIELRVRAIDLPDLGRGTCLVMFDDRWPAESPLEAELQRMRTRVHNLMMSTDIGVVFLDRDLHLTWFTPRISDVIEVIPNDLGRPFAHLTHRLECDDLPRLAAQVLHDLRTIEREVRTRDGRPYRARLLPFRSLEDRIEGVVLTLVEVSELREAVDARNRSEAELEAVAERLRLAVSSSPLIVISLDATGDPVWGYARGKELAREQLTQLCSDAAATSFAAIAREVGGTRVSRHVELELVVHGAPHTYDLRFEPGSTGVTAVGFDVTSSKAAKAVLLEADRRKDEFLATLSHELRNPLSALKSALDVVKLDGARRDDGLAVIDRQAEQLTRLVDELLDLSRIARGTIELEQELIDPADLVGPALEVLRPQLEQRGHRIEVSLPPSSVAVLGDRARLGQVMINVLSNAVKFTPDGGRIAIAIAADVARCLVIVRVGDTGIGIDPEFLPHVFDMFVQGKEAGGRAHGLGIGLNLVRRIVELHGGRVSVTSAGQDRGTELVVELPLVTR